jgi:hypothetical protein
MNDVAKFGVRLIGSIVVSLVTTVVTAVYSPDLIEMANTLRSEAKAKKEELKRAREQGGEQHE